jgi:hypothetical protein
MVVLVVDLLLLLAQQILVGEEVEVVMALDTHQPQAALE